MPIATGSPAAGTPDREVHRAGRAGTPPSAAAQPQPITRVPGWTHDPRLQCAPDEMPFGAGFAAAGVGVDITTGRSWK